MKKNKTLVYIRSTQHPGYYLHHKEVDGGGNQQYELKEGTTGAAMLNRDAASVFIQNLNLQNVELVDVRKVINT